MESEEVLNWYYVAKCIDENMEDILAEQLEFEVGRIKEIRDIINDYSQNSSLLNLLADIQSVIERKN